MRVTTLAAVASAIALGGCGNIDVGPGAGWFSKPIDFFGKSGGFSFQEFKDTNKLRPITPNDLVDASGACPAVAAPAPAPAPAPPPQSPDGSDGSQPAAIEPPSLLGGGIGLGMTECDVVQRAGAANAVNLGNTPGGDRSVMLTYNTGPRPGIYRFTAGRLVDIERVAEPPPPPEAAKKKRPVKPKTAKNDSN